MKKKRLIILLSVLAVIVVIVVLSSTVFTLKSVEIHFYDKNDKIIDDVSHLKRFDQTMIDEAILAADFNMGQNMFLVKKDKPKQNLEKQCPYIKVIAMTSHFPNKIVIKAIEREELYAIKIENSEEYAITDGELKVLRFANSFEQFDAIEVKGLEVAIGEAILGEVIDNGIKTNNAKNLVPSLQTCFNIILELKSTAILTLFESVEFYKEYSTDGNFNQVDWVRLKTREVDESGNIVAGLSFEIENINHEFEDKLFEGLKEYNTILNGEWIETPRPDKSVGIIKVYYHGGAVYTLD